MKFLYCITNTANGKSYIGVSNNPKKRFKHHFSKNCGSVLLYRAGKKYGKKNFKLEILGVGEDDFIFELEKQEIKLQNTRRPRGYNIAPGGGNPPTGARLGYKCSVAVCKRLRTARIGTKHTEATKKKMSASRKGRFFSDKHKKRISQALLGKKVTEETREKLRKINIGKKLSKETKLKISRPGDKNPAAKCVLVEGIKYLCMKSAARAIGITYSAIAHRFCRYRKNNEYPFGWADFDGGKQIPNKLLQKKPNHMAKAVMIDNKEYDCMKDAARAIRVDYKTLSARFCRYKKNNKFPDGWAYL